jgi:proteasome activator subunit 4
MDNRKRWWYRIADERKLTDDDINKFVKTTSYVVLDFYLDITICGFVLKNLACIRPNIIIPAVMEKYEGMVETVTEPRKYMTALRWVTVILLPLISSRKELEGYDGRRLVLPFAMSLLPAIDPNDMFKTLTALGCLHGLVSLLPFVDCSHLADTLEDEVRWLLIFDSVIFLETDFLCLGRKGAVHQHRVFGGFSGSIS